MPSILSNPVRVAPQQKRSERRLAAFLDAAAALFVEVGYEAATMTAIAERSASSIGALYNCFPDKQAIALTLVNQYGQELEAYWKPLIEQAAKLTHREFADLFIERITELVRQRPAYLSLATAPVRFRRPPAASPSACARPIPLPAPVTIATFPAKSAISSASPRSVPTYRSIQR